MNNLKKMDEVSFGISLLGLITLVFFILSMFSAFSSKAETAVSPSSYLSDGDGVVIVNGQPKYYNGKLYDYKTVHSIPIRPAVETSDGEVYPVPNNDVCPGQGKLGWCGKKFSSNKPSNK